MFARSDYLVEWVHPEYPVLPTLRASRGKSALLRLSHSATPNQFTPESTHNGASAHSFASAQLFAPVMHNLRKNFLRWAETEKLLKLDAPTAGNARCRPPGALLGSMIDMCQWSTGRFTNSTSIRTGTPTRKVKKLTARAALVDRTCR